MSAYALLGDDTDFARACADMCERYGFERSDVGGALFAIAPLLTKKIPELVWSAPHLGTLIFHPSALPYRRGPDAIRHTVAAGERVSAATWFWCDAGLDTGPICEQEVVVLCPGESAGRAYHTRFIPAGLRALERALHGIVSGSPRRVAQEPELATYDRRIPKHAAPPNGALVYAAAVTGGDCPDEAKPLVDALRS